MPRPGSGRHIGNGLQHPKSSPGAFLLHRHFRGPLVETLIECTIVRDHDVGKTSPAAASLEIHSRIGAGHGRSASALTPSPPDWLRVVSLLTATAISPKGQPRAFLIASGYHAANQCHRFHHAHAGRRLSAFSDRTARPGGRFCGMVPHAWLEKRDRSPCGKRFPVVFVKYRGAGGIGHRSGPAARAWRIS